MTLARTSARSSRSGRVQLPPHLPLSRRVRSHTPCQPATTCRCSHKSTRRVSSPSPLLSERETRILIIASPGGLTFGRHLPTQRSQRPKLRPTRTRPRNVTANPQQPQQESRLAKNSNSTPKVRIRPHWAGQGRAGQMEDPDQSSKHRQTRQQPRRPPPPPPARRTSSRRPRARQNPRRSLPSLLRGPQSRRHRRRLRPTKPRARTMAKEKGKGNPKTTTRTTRRRMEMRRVAARRREKPRASRERRRVRVRADSRRRGMATAMMTR